MCLCSFSRVVGGSGVVRGGGCQTTTSLENERVTRRVVAEMMVEGKKGAFDETEYTIPWCLLFEAVQTT